MSDFYANRLGADDETELHNHSNKNSRFQAVKPQSCR